MVDGDNDNDNNTQHRIRSRTTGYMIKNWLKSKTNEVVECVLFDKMKVGVESEIVQMMSQLHVATWKDT